MKSLAVFLILFSTSIAFSELRPAGTSSPECYTGEVETAMLDLLLGGFDPIFSEENSYINGETIVGVQIDIDGDEVVSNIIPCK